VVIAALQQPAMLGKPVAAAEEARQLIDLGEYDFGTIVGAQRESHVFSYVNNTEDTWTLNRTSKECGCLEIGRVSLTVAPGESFRLEIVLDTKEQTTHQFNRRAFAVLAPNNLGFVCRAVAYIIAAPEAKPPALFSQLQSNQDRYALTTEILGGREFTAYEVEPMEENSAMQVQLAEPTVGEDGISRVGLDVSGTIFSPGGSVNTHIVVRATGPKATATVRVPLEVVRLRHMVAIPSEIHLEGDASGLIGRFQLIRPGGSAVGAAQVTIAPPCKGSRISFDPETGFVEIVFTVPSNHIPSDCVVNVSDSKGGTLRLPLHADRHGPQKDS